ncbi:MAG: HNH endonuclease [Anaerolineae bacterium]|nr:HNH endonuclease [Anaerolineae bacterium]
MSDISAATRQRVRERAENRCEYCLSHQNYVMGRLQIDHVQPIAKGGSNAEDNLCLACELCNQHKWTKTHGIDPQTEQHTPLFNPRQQNWAEHFAWSPTGTEIVGLTTTGRVTVIALNLNNSLALTVRRNWIKAGWHPPKS